MGRPITRIQSPLKPVRVGIDGHRRGLIHLAPVVTRQSVHRGGDKETRRRGRQSGRRLQRLQISRNGEPSTAFSCVDPEFCLGARCADPGGFVFRRRRRRSRAPCRWSGTRRWPSSWYPLASCSPPPSSCESPFVRHLLLPLVPCDLADQSWCPDLI